MTLDSDTLARLYRDEGPALLAFCARRTLDSDLALDMVGETFAVAFERRASFRGSSREEAVGWLFSIARTALHHYYRRGGAETRALARLGVEPPTIDDAEREAIEELAGLTRTLTHPVQTSLGSRIVLLLPDGVARVDLIYPRLVSRGPYRDPVDHGSVLRVSAPVRDNVATLRVSGRPSTDLFGPEVIERAADGRVVRRVPADHP